MIPTITKLRSIAQAMGIKNVFALPREKLEQAIQGGTKDIATVQESVSVPVPVFQVNHAPDAIIAPPEIDEAIAPYIKMGLRISYTDDAWTMNYDGREDSGSLSMPVKSIVKCAEKVLRGY